MIGLATGKEQRSVELGGNFGCAPAYASGCVFVGSMDGAYYSVRLSDARVMWQREETRTGAAIFASAAVIGDAVIFPSRSNAVFRVHRKTGREVWSFSTRGDVNSSPVINGQHVFFGSGDGNLYRVRLADGVKDWQFSAGAGISASPAIGQRRLVIGAEDGAVYCFG
jgi:outer membrane protein assembly factor BamB